MMNLSRRELVDIVGLLSVALSLLFVGQQLRLESRLAFAEQYADRSESMKDDLRTRMESDAYIIMLTEAWDRGDRPPWWTTELEDHVEKLSISGADLHISNFDRQLLYYQDDNLYFQYQQGLLSEEFWLSVRENLARRLATEPLTRAIYENRTITRELDEVVQEILTEIDEK